MEVEPILQVSDFASAPATKGPGYSIESKAQVTGYQGQFVIHMDLGDVSADGVGLLKQRIAEVGPAIELQKLSSSSVFADALAQSAKKTAKSVGRAVTNPGDTVKGIPAGVGRFFKSVGEGVQGAASSSSEGDTSGAVKDTLGINKAKRQIAKKIGVDPYTTNPTVSARLDELANAAFAGGVSLDVVMTVSMAGLATAVSLTETVSDMAWQLPPEDIRARNDADLAALKVDEATRAKLLGNRWYSPSMALAFVQAMKELSVSKGAVAFVQLAAGAASETEARFFITQLHMANRFAKSGDAIVAIAPQGKVGAFRTARGKLFVPAPLDYLSWTQGVKAFVSGKGLQSGERVVWLTGKASPTALEHLRSAGWQLREGVALE